MPTSGTIRETYVDSVFGNVMIMFEWKRASYSVYDNSSTIDWELSLYSLGDTLFWNSEKYYEVRIHGETYSGYADPDLPGDTTKSLASGQQKIYHASDGTCSFAFSFSYQKLTGSDSVSASGTGYLDSLPRPAIINSATDFNDEENPTITYTNPTSSSTALEACISFTGETDDIPYRQIDARSGSYTFELTDDERKILRQGIASGSSRTVRFYIRSTMYVKLQTYTEWTHLTKTLTLVNHEPVIAPTIIDNNPITARLTGSINKLVRYQSDAFYIMGAGARKEATLVNHYIINGSKRFENKSTGTFTEVEDNTFYLGARDSRGLSKQETVVFEGDNFIPYFNVTCAQTVTLNINQTINLNIEGKYYNGSFGAEDNELIIETRIRKSGEEWGTWTDISPLISEITSDSYKLNTTLSGYDPSGTYEFQCRAMDKLSAAASTTSSITLKPIFDWGAYDFNFNVPLTIEGDSLDDFVIETGSEAMGTNGVWHWRKWRNGRAECYGCRNYGNMAVTTSWGGLFRSETFTQDLPSGLFIETPEVIDISLRGTGNYGGWIVRHEESAPNEFDTGSFIVVRPASATISQAYISFNIIGRWK